MQLHLMCFLFVYFLIELSQILSILTFDDFLGSFKKKFTSLEALQIQTHGLSTALKTEPSRLQLAALHPTPLPKEVEQ